MGSVSSMVAMLGTLKWVPSLVMFQSGPKDGYWPAASRYLSPTVPLHLIRTSALQA